MIGKSVFKEWTKKRLSFPPEEKYSESKDHLSPTTSWSWHKYCLTCFFPDLKSKSFILLSLDPVSSLLLAKLIVAMRDSCCLKSSIILWVSGSMSFTCPCMVPIATDSEYKSKHREVGRS